MLLDLEKKQLAAVPKIEGTPAFPIGTLTDLQLYPFPRYGEVNGMPVRIDGEANRVGFSPVSLCVELGTHINRETAWISTGTVKNRQLEPYGFAARGRTTPGTGKPLSTAAAKRAKTANAAA